MQTIWFNIWVTIDSKNGCYMLAMQVGAMNEKQALLKAKSVLGNVKCVAEEIGE